jgi:hypothetical protein
LAVLVEIVSSSISSRMHSAKVHRRGAGYSSVEMENAEALLASPRRSPNRKCMSDVPALHNFALSQPINQDPRSFLGRGVHFFAFTASVLAADQSVRD